MIMVDDAEDLAEESRAAAHDGIGNVLLIHGLLRQARVGAAVRTAGGDDPIRDRTPAAASRAALPPRSDEVRAPRPSFSARLLRWHRGALLLPRDRTYQRRRRDAAQLHRADLQRDVLDALHRREDQPARAAADAGRAHR